MNGAQFPQAYSTMWGVDNNPFLKHAAITVGAIPSSAKLHEKLSALLEFGHFQLSSQGKELKICLPKGDAGSGVGGEDLDKPWCAK